MSHPAAAERAALRAMHPVPIRAADVPPQPWRNGGGRTRELLAWPAGDGWKLRISLADIDADGPFSAFAGVQRWFAVIAGAGVVLTLPGGERRLTTADAPLAFEGAAAPGCRLVAGPTRDLNLMLREGTRGSLQRAVSGQAWSELWPWRACFTSGAAQWLGAEGLVLDLEANTLLCYLGSAPCSLVARDTEAPMFWIGADLGGEVSA